nr:hypothetical protein [Limnoglobus roseus]
MAGLTELKFKVYDGTEDECAIDAAASNQGHGLKRSNADKRRCVEMLLKLLPEHAASVIAEKAGVSGEMVAEVRKAVLSDSDNTAPATVIGKDGRRYKARKPKKNGRSQEDKKCVSAARIDQHIARIVCPMQVGRERAHDHRGDAGVVEHIVLHDHMRMRVALLRPRDIGSDPENVTAVDLLRWFFRLRRHEYAHLIVDPETETAR